MSVGSEVGLVDMIGVNGRIQSAILFPTGSADYEKWVKDDWGNKGNLASGQIAASAEVGADVTLGKNFFLPLHIGATLEWQRHPYDPAMAGFGRDPLYKSSLQAGFSLAHYGGWGIGTLARSAFGLSLLSWIPGVEDAARSLKSGPLREESISLTFDYRNNIGNYGANYNFGPEQRANDEVVRSEYTKAIWSAGLRYKISPKIPVEVYWSYGSASKMFGPPITTKEFGVTYGIPLFKKSEPGEKKP